MSLSYTAYINIGIAVLFVTLALWGKFLSGYEPSEFTVDALWPLSILLISHDTQ